MAGLKKLITRQCNDTTVTTRRGEKKKKRKKKEEKRTKRKKKKKKQKGVVHCEQGFLWWSSLICDGETGSCEEEEKKAENVEQGYLKGDKNAS